MTPSLVLNEYVWAVSVVSKDDGHTFYAAHFTDHSEAEKAARRLGGNVVQTSLYFDRATGTYYKARLERVPVDLPDRDEVLARLSPAEREALGIR
jgi:hypothetical protein